MAPCPGAHTPSRPFPELRSRPLCGLTQLPLYPITTQGFPSTLRVLDSHFCGKTEIPISPEERLLPSIPAPASLPSHVLCERAGFHGFSFFPRFPCQRADMALRHPRRPQKVGLEPTPSLSVNNLRGTEGSVAWPSGTRISFAFDYTQRQIQKFTANHREGFTHAQNEPILGT